MEWARPQFYTMIDGGNFDIKRHTHYMDVGLAAVWVFFATSHVKSPYDGISGPILKRITAKVSL